MCADSSQCQVPGLCASSHKSSSQPRRRYVSGVVSGGGHRAPTCQVTKEGLALQRPAPFIEMLRRALICPHHFSFFYAVIDGSLEDPNSFFPPVSVSSAALSTHVYPLSFFNLFNAFATFLALLYFALNNSISISPMCLGLLGLYMSVLVY